MSEGNEGNEGNERNEGNEGIPHLLRMERYKDIAMKTKMDVVLDGKRVYKRALTRQAVSGICRGVTGYSKDSLARIASVLEVSPGWLANYIEHKGKEGRS